MTIYLWKSVTKKSIWEFFWLNGYIAQKILNWDEWKKENVADDLNIFLLEKTIESN